MDGAGRSGDDGRTGEEHKPELPYHDLVAVVELRGVHATAIDIGAVQTSRIVTSTYVSDTTDGLECDGVFLEPPYRIRAIGEPQNLQNAVAIAGGVGSKLKVKFGSTVKVTSSKKVVISETKKTKQYTYARTVE